MSEKAPAEEAPRPEGVADGDESEASERSDAAPARHSTKPRKRRKKAGAKAPSSRGMDADAGSDDEESPAVVVRAKERDARPAFAASFPNDPALDDLVRAFEQGHYARIRKEAPALAKRTESAAVRKAARELARRIEPDPLAVYLILGAALLLVFLAAWYWSHPHEVP